jgi:N-acetylmuramoyl-L-alanine amidase
MKIRHVLIILSVILLSAGSADAAEILNIRYWAAPDHTRVVIDVRSDPSMEVQEGEKLLTLNFRQASVRPSLSRELAINKPGIKKVIIHPAEQGLVRIDLVLDEYLKTQVFRLKNFQDKPYRVVVDIFLEPASSDEKIKESLPKMKRDKIIVIDPGHGGDDPGAIGTKGTYEKNIVLSIGREIKKAVNNIPGYRAVLTRDGDYYVSFNKRLQTAKDANASLFISVHADAARNRLAKGCSIYCLSTGGATNEAAKLLARNENLSDIIGGVPNGEGKTESDQIILNMFQTNTINLSKIYASNLIEQLGGVSSLKYRNVQEAPFRVLKLPDIPAVLIETAYISNVEEERLLKSIDFQKKLAKAVASSATEYLSDAANGRTNDAGRVNEIKDKSRETELPAKVDGLREIATDQYKIKKGDTLFSIAHLFNTRVAVLLKLNKLNLEDPLFIGRKIQVPAVKPVPDDKNDGGTLSDERPSGRDKRPARTYIVKKGDTLFSLARNNSLSVDELRKLNNMKNSEPLLTGRKIKVP